MLNKGVDLLASNFNVSLFKSYSAPAIHYKGVILQKVDDPEP